MADKKEKPSRDVAKAEKKLEKAKAKEAKRLATEENGDEEESVGGKIAVALIAVVVLAVWLAIFGLLIKLDVGGFGSTVMYPILKDVPYLNLILPEAKQYAEVDEQYAYATVDEAVEEIKRLEIELEEAKLKRSDNESYVSNLEAEVEQLRTYKEKQEAFEEMQKKFYEEVVFSDEAPDILEYKKYYESIDPASAAEIYKTVAGEVIKDKDLEKYVATYSNMKPKEAAAIFDTMTNDLRLVAKILWNIEDEARADILAAMDEDLAAKLTEMLEP